MRFERVTLAGGGVASALAPSLCAFSFDGRATSRIITAAKTNLDARPIANVIGSFSLGLCFAVTFETLLRVVEKAFD